MIWVAISLYSAGRIITLNVQITACVSVDVTRCMLV